MIGSEGHYTQGDKVNVDQSSVLSVVTVLFSVAWGYILLQVRKTKHEIHQLRQDIQDIRRVAHGSLDVLMKINESSYKGTVDLIKRTKKIRPWGQVIAHAKAIDAINKRLSVLENNP